LEEAAHGQREDWKLARLKAHLDTREFREAIKDAGIAKPEEFRQMCLAFCQDLYDTAAAEWLEYFEIENDIQAKFEGAALLDHYPALQSCWLGDIQAAITRAADSKDTDRDERDFYYFMLGIVRSAWNEHIRKKHGGQRGE
jgi:hypothetical protein